MDPVSITALTAYAGTLVGPLLEWSGKVVAPAAKSAAGEALAQLTKEPRRRVAEKFMLWLSEGKLPPDDPLASASRIALAQALSWMAAGMESEPDAEARAELEWRLQRGLSVEAVQFLAPERRAWIKSLRSLLKDDERLIELERRRLEREDFARLLQTSTHQASADELHRRTRDWLNRHLGTVGAPTEQLDNFLGKGWPLPGRPQHMTLYQAWCAWFGHNMKRRPELFNSFVTAALADVVQLVPPREDAAQTFSDCLEEPLGQLRHIVDRILPITESIDYRTREMFSMLQEMQERGVPPRAPARDSAATSAFWNDELDAAQQVLLDALVTESATAAIADATIEAVIEAEPKGLRGWLLQRYARASRSQGTASLFNKGAVWLDADFIAPQLQLRPKDNDTPALRFDALTELLLQPSPTSAWLIVGDAGAGKTTLLRHHEMEQVRDLLRRLARPNGESLVGARLCIRVRLSTYRREGSGADLHWPDCEQWLQAQWARQARPGVLPSLEEMRRWFRLRFLLDGVNEIEAEASAAVRQQAMRRFAAWVEWQGRAQPAPVFTVRRHDLGTALSGLRRASEIRLGRWSAGHVERFCRRCGGDAHGALWQRLKSDPHLMALCQVPFNLVAQRALLERGYLAGSRAELFLGLLWLSLKRGMHKGDLLQPGLLSSPDLNKLADDEHWKGARSRRMLPMEGTLLRGLAQQARDMAPALDIAYEKAARFDKADQFAGWSARDRQCWLEAVQSLGLAEVRIADGEFFAFAHQLWQEFFLACSWGAQGDAPAAVADWAARASRPDEMNLAETYIDSALKC